MKTETRPRGRPSLDDTQRDIARQNRINSGADSLKAFPLSARDDENLIVFKELRPLGITYTTVHLRRLEAAGKFPKRVRLSERRVCWRVADIRAYLRNAGVAHD